MKLGERAGAGYALSDASSQIEITGLTADSREVMPGVLFAAWIPGQAGGFRDGKAVTLV